MAWETILKIREEIDKQSANTEHLSINSSSLFNHISDPEKDSYTIKIVLSEEKFDAPEADMVITCSHPFLANINYIRPIPEYEKRIFDLYVPYVLLPHFARKLKKTFVITHFAQTLDGRIASVSGNSKWIGNQQNLVHAHRMRALIDGIIIGSKTLTSDNPKLNVRHVEGNDPYKILIGGDNLDLEEFHIAQGEKIVFGQNQQSSNKKTIRYRLEKKKNVYNTRIILDKLFELGIYSVYIEGGSITTSTFLNQQTVDQVQIHIAPIILGSGITGFNFKGIKFLDKAIHFKSYKYHSVGDQMMFIGELN